MEKTPFVYVALDGSSQSANLSLVQSLVDNVHSPNYGFKVNLDSVLDFAPDAKKPHDLLQEVVSFGRPVFLDLKLWNGGRTMSQIASGAANLGVSIVNVYAQAGVNFMKKVAKSIEGSKTELFGLTVLTHYTEQDARDLYNTSLSSAVRMLAERSADGGATGIVVPPTQLAVVADLPLKFLTPAIRPEWYADKKANSQEQTATPQEALAQGADYLVIGSPISKSTDPSSALERILLEIGA